MPPRAGPSPFAQLSSTFATAPCMPHRLLSMHCWMLSRPVHSLTHHHHHHHCTCAGRRQGWCWQHLGADPARAGLQAQVLQRHRQGQGRLRGRKGGQHGTLLWGYCWGHKDGGGVGCGVHTDEEGALAGPCLVAMSRSLDSCGGPLAHHLTDLPTVAVYVCPLCRSWQPCCLPPPRLSTRQP